MLLSPPFLPPRGTLDEPAWLDLAMTPADQGVFPVTRIFGWHGGMHLIAPLDNSRVGLPVRAVADGEVIYVRRPEDNANDAPLKYAGGYTSHPVVVIRHTTDIGANAQGVPVKVTFYSVYLHLHNVRPAIKLKSQIYRKDEIGQAGYIYGEPNRLHFEICCDDDNLALLFGRKSGPLPIGADGRSDVVFGEMYFALAAGTAVYGEKPMPTRSQAMSQPAPAPQRADQPRAAVLPARPLQPTYTAEAAFFVGVNYAGGEGAPGQRGDAVVTTYMVDGSIVGVPLREAEAEYTLYTTSTRISQAYPEGSRPTPAAVYELLRFGRVIGPDVLSPVDVPHWRHINYPGGSGWVNLNAADVHKFSDADFPHWRGWTLVDDDRTADSHCDSPTIAAIVRGPDDASAIINRTQRAERLSNPVVRARLSRTVCKFPSEWDASTIDNRWKWVKTASADRPDAFTAADYDKLTAHITALCFPLPELFKAQWSFHPRQFIEIFRKCGWMSLRETTQLLPRRPSPAQPSREMLWGVSRGRLEPYYSDLNRARRKYGFISSGRWIHFLAQVYIETGLWKSMEEYLQGRPQVRNGAPYWATPATEYYQIFYGRGAMQLTWAGNYELYGMYRGFASMHPTNLYADPRITRSSTHYWEDPRDRSGNVVRQPRVWWPRYDPRDISANAFNACDSAAHYWVSKKIGAGASNMHRVADRGVNIDAVARLSVLVNGGAYGFTQRQSYAKFIERYLADEIDVTPDRSFMVSHRGANLNVHIDFTPQRPD